ncbi:MAG: substrate-binding domain-containing protein [Anaerolineae bacterium]
MFRKASFLLLVIAISLGLVVGPVAAQGGEVLKIGVLTDQTSALQLYGFEQVQGFEIGLDYATNGTRMIGGRPVEVIVRDNGGDADTAAQQARELIEVEGVEVLFGTVSSGVTLGLKQIAAENDIVLFMGPSAAGILTMATNEEEQALLNNAFRICRSSSQDAFAYAAYAVENVGENFVIFAADYIFGQATAASYEAAIPAAGGRFVRDTIYAPLDTTDFTPYAQEILDSGADGMVLIWAGGGIGTMYQQFQELGVFDKVAVVAPFSSSADLIAANQPNSVGVGIYHWSLPNTDANRYLVQQHLARYDETPDLFSECGFSTAQAITYGIEKAIESGADPVDATLPEFLVPALEGLEFDGVKGHYTIRAGDHQALMPMYIVYLYALSERYGVFFDVIDEVLPEEYNLPCVALNCS